MRPLKGEGLMAEHEVDLFERAEQIRARIQAEADRTGEDRGVVLDRALARVLARHGLVLGVYGSWPESG